MEPHSPLVGSDHCAVFKLAQVKVGLSCISTWSRLGYHSETACVLCYWSIHSKSHFYCFSTNAVDLQIHIGCDLVIVVSGFNVTLRQTSSWKLYFTYVISALLFSTNLFDKVQKCFKVTVISSYWKAIDLIHFRNICAIISGCIKWWGGKINLEQLLNFRNNYWLSCCMIADYLFEFILSLQLVL